MEHSWVSRITGMSLFISICIALVISFSARTTATAPGALSARDATLSSSGQEAEAGDQASAPLAVAVNAAKEQQALNAGLASGRQAVLPPHF